MSGALSWGTIGVLAGEEGEAGAPFGPVGWVIAGVAMVATAVVGGIMIAHSGSEEASEATDGAKTAGKSFAKADAKETIPCQKGPPEPKQELEKEELDKIGPLKGLSPEEIGDKLKELGYGGPITGNNGGDIYIKNLPNGRSIRIRVDPAEIRKNPKGWADETPHVHKEAVDTGANDNDTAGKSAGNQIRYDDTGCPSNNPEDVHIPITEE